MNNILRDKNGLTEEEFLAAYDPTKWERPSVTVDMVCYCTENDSILMVKRGNHPFMGKWALPGGFLEPNETAEQAVRRELMEETGVETDAIVQLRTFSNPKRDPRTRIVTVAYLAVLEKLPNAAAGDDAADAKWFRLSYGENDDCFKGTITLDGEETLKIKYDVKYSESWPPCDPEVAVEASERIAGDHAEIITWAGMYLTKSRYR